MKEEINWIFVKIFFTVSFFGVISKLCKIVTSSCIYLMFQKKAW